MASKSKIYCSVPQCSNYKTDSVSIHIFPKDPVLLKKWTTALRIGKPVTRGMSVCSEHFLPNDFHPLRAYSTKRYLKIGVVPSQKIPVRIHDQQKPSNSSSFRILRALKRLENRELQIETGEDIMKVEIVDTKDAEISSAEDLMLLCSNTNVENIVHSDESVQVNVLPSEKDIRIHEYILDSTFKMSHVQL